MNVQRIVKRQIDDLKVRNVVPWLDVDGIWARHMNRKTNHADILKMLFSLEVNLKGLEKQAALGRVVGL